MSLFQRKTFWNISSSKRFLLNHFLLFTDLISFHCFFHLSPALDPWFAFLSGSVYSCLSSSLSVSPFFLSPRGVTVSLLKYFLSGWKNASQLPAGIPASAVSVLWSLVWFLGLQSKRWRPSDLQFRLFFWGQPAESFVVWAWEKCEEMDG